MTTLIHEDPHLATRKLTPDLLEYIIQKVVAAVDPQKIILFGSWARGNAGSDSDLDLFIVYDGDENERIVRRKIDLLFWGREFGMDILVSKPEEVAMYLQRREPFYLYHIFRDGKVVYERK